MLSSRRLRDVYFGFSVKMSQIKTENDKKPTFLNFQSFHAFLLRFQQTSWIGIL